MAKPRHARIVLLVLGATAAIVALGAIVTNGLLHAMKESWAKRQLSDVTTIAIAIEDYRAEHGRLPSRDELAQAGNLGKVIQQRHVFVTLKQTSYIVAEAEPGLDARQTQTWRVVDGRWQRWSPYNSRELVLASERDILSRRTLPR